MANSIADITPQLLAQGLLALREAAVMPQIVNRRYESQAGDKGSTIDVPIPSAVADQDVVPGPVPPTTADVAPTTVPIALDKWREAPFYLTDKDELEVMSGVIPMQASEAIKSLANYVNRIILGLYIKFYGFAGTPGTTPFASGTTEATAIRRVLQKQLAPPDDRHLVIDVDAEANALNLRPFQDISWSGDPGPINAGKLNKKLGFQWWPHQLAPIHTAGTAITKTITLTSNSAAGVFSVTLAVNTSTGTLVEGDIITIAGDPQTYVVTGAVTLTTGGVATGIQPALQLAANGSVTPVAVTLKASHQINLAFHRDAIAFATRPLKNVEPGLGSQTSVATDPDSGLALRLEVTREHKRTRWSFDILFGAAVVRRQLGARLAG